MTKIAVDGDVLVYSCGFAAQRNIHTLWLGDRELGKFEYKKELQEAWGQDAPCHYTTEIEAEPVANALHNVKLAMEQILDECKGSNYKVYLSGGGNYRQGFYPEYKANRDPTHKPVHYSSIKSYLIDHWHGTVVEGIEADDAIGIAGYCHDAIMSSIDKDLLMIPGRHYHLRSNNHVEISEPEGNLIFLRQWLTGDPTDNIPGIKGLGKKKAEKLLPDGISCQEAYGVVMDQYKTEEEAYLNGSLVWILREKLTEYNQTEAMRQIKSYLGVN
jgi:hypothetical protein